jgi:hypothetical protein
MRARWTFIATSGLLVGAVAASSALVAHTGAAARMAAAATATPIPTNTPSAHPLTPTPIPSHRQSITLPKPVVLVVGSKTVGTGLSEKAAFQLANDPKNQVTFLIAPPTHTPAKYALQLITVLPAQNAQSPAQVSLQYIPKGLSKVSGTFPSVNLFKQLGRPTLIINPGGKVQTVTIRAGKNGIGVVKGQLADIKFKNGPETVEIGWQVNGVNYELTSVVSLSKLSIKELLATAGSFQ